MTEQWSPQELEAVRRRLEGLRRNVVQAAAAEPDAENAESAPEIELPEAVTDAEPDAAAEEAAAVEALEPIVRAAEQAEPAELGGILRRLAALARSADSPAVRRVARRRLRALVERWLRRLADGRVDPAADRAVVAALAVLGGTGLLPQGALASVLAPVEEEVAAARAGHDQPSDPRAAFADRLLARMHSNIRCATLAERAERFAEHATHEGSVRFADAIEQRVTRSNLMALERFGQTLGIAESFTRFDRRFGMLDAVLGGALEQDGEGTLARALASALGVDLALRGQGPAAARRWLAAMPQLVVALRASGAIAEEEGGVAAVAAGYEGPRPVDPTPARHPRLVGWPEMMEFHSERRPWYGFSEPARGWRSARVGYAGFEGGLGARTSHTSTFGALGALPRALTATAFSGFEPAPAHAQAVRTFGGMSHVALGYGGIAATRTQWQAGRELQRALGARARGGADLLVGAGAPDLPRLALAQLGLRSAPPAAASGGRWTDLSLDRFGLPRLRGSVRLPLAAMQASGGLDPLGSLVLQPGASPTSRRQAAVRRPLVLAPDAFGRLRLRSAELGAPPAAVTVPSFVLEPAAAPGAPTLRRTNVLESLAVSGGTSMPGFRVPAPVAGRTAARWTRAAAPAADLSFTTWRTELQWLAPAAPLLSAAPAASSWAGPSPARALPTAAWRGLGVQPLASPRGFGVGHAGFAPSQPQPRIGGAGAAVFAPQQLGAGAPVSARGITVPAPLRKYYAPALRPGLALGATARFGLAGFGGGRAAAEALVPRARRLAAPTYDFAPPELARLTSGFGHDAIRAVAPVAPWQARPRQIAFDAAGFAPAARLGRTASFEIEAAGLAAPRWFRFGRTLDAVRSRYSGERLHAPHELHLPVGTRRVASDAPRIAAPRLEAVYGRRWRFDVPVGQGADALGLGAHGLEGRYAAQRWLETSRSLTIEPALYGGGVTGVRGPVFATTGAPGMDTLQLGGRSVPAAAPRSARAASRRGARVPSGAAPAARLGAGAGAGFIPMPSTGSRTVTSYVQVLEALGLGAGAPALGGMVALPAEPGLRAAEPVSLQVGQGATGRRGWAPIAAPRTGFADRFRLDGWLPAPASVSGRGGQGGSVGALGATGRRLGRGVGGRARSFAPPVTPATIPLDLVSQLGGVTDRVARAAARRLAWAPPVAAGARRPTFALAQLAPLADEQTSGPLGGSIAMGSRRRVVSHRRDRVFAIGGSARRAAARAARLAAPLADTGATAGLEELAAVVPSRPAARRRTGRVPTLEGIELGGAFIERRRRSRFDAQRLRRVGVPVPIGSEWIEAIEQTERQGADMPLVQRLAAPRARSSDTAPISLAVGQGGRGPSALSRLVDEVVGRPRTVGRRPAIEQARAFERTRREVESGLAWLGGDEAVAQRREPVRPSRGLSDAFRPRTDRDTRRWSGFESQPPRSPAAFGRVREPVEARPPRLKMVNTGVGAPREQFDLAEVLQQAFDLPEEALPVMRKGLFSGLATNIKKSLGEVTQWIAQLEKLRKPRQRTPDISQLVYQVYDRIKSEMEWEAMRRGVV